MIDRRFARRADSWPQTIAALAGKVQLLSISFDPQFDRAEVLRAHAARLGADPTGVALRDRRGSRSSIASRREFGINVIREKDGTITHNLRTAVVDPAGRVTSIVDNNAWTADELAASLKNAVAAAR